MHAVGRPSRHSPPAVVALATSPGVGAGPRRGRLGVRVRLAERGVPLVSEGGRQETRSPPEGEDSATFRKKRRRILSSSKRQVWFLSLAAFANPPSHLITTGNCPKSIRSQRPRQVHHQRSRPPSRVRYRQRRRRQRRDPCSSLCRA